MKTRKLLLMFILFNLYYSVSAQKRIYHKEKTILLKEKCAKCTDTLKFHITLTEEKDDKYILDLKKDSTNYQSEFRFLNYDVFAVELDKGIKVFTGCDSSCYDNEIQLIFTDLLLNAISLSDAPLAGMMDFKDTVKVGIKAKIYTANLKSHTTYLLSKYHMHELSGRKYKRLHGNLDEKKILKTRFKLNVAKVNEKTYRAQRLDSRLEVISRSLGTADDKTDELYEGIEKENEILFVPDDIKIEFSDGLIRNIRLTGFLQFKENKDLNNAAVFCNSMPIGFSSIRDIEKISECCLYTEVEYDNRYYRLEVPLSEFINYYPNFRINTRDYCPENQVVERNYPIESVQLFKESAGKILSAKVFTDVLGLQEGNPNGIVQTEIEKKISLYSKRNMGFLFFRKANYGFLQYVKPYGVISKIDKQNRYLEMTENHIDSVNVLNLLQYESFRVGSDLNIFTFDGTTSKSTLFWDFGMAFSKVIVSDTTANETAEVNKTHLNCWNVYLKLMYDLFPDERYGLKFLYKIDYYTPLKDKISLFKIKENSKNKNYLQTMSIEAFLKTGSTGKLFFRYRLNSSFTNWEKNFAQVQVGYSFDITKQLKENRN